MEVEMGRWKPGVIQKASDVCKVQCVLSRIWTSKYNELEHSCKERSNPIFILQ